MCCRIETFDLCTLGLQLLPGGNKSDVLLEVVRIARILTENSTSVAFEYLMSESVSTVWPGIISGINISSIANDVCRWSS